MTDLRTAAQQALECLRGVARGKYDGNAAGVCAALEAALAQQAERVLELKAQRDALLEALKEMLEVWGEDSAYGHASAEKARAAIEAVEENT